MGSASGRARCGTVGGVHGPRPAAANAAAGLRRPPTHPPPPRPTVVEGLGPGAKRPASGLEAALGRLGVGEGAGLARWVYRRAGTLAGQHDDDALAACCTAGAGVAPAAETAPGSPLRYRRVAGRVRKHGDADVVDLEAVPDGAGGGGRGGARLAPYLAMVREHLEREGGGSGRGVEAGEGAAARDATASGDANPSSPSSSAYVYDVYVADMEMDADAVDGPAPPVLRLHELDGGTPTSSASGHDSEDSNAESFYANDYPDEESGSRDTSSDSWGGGRWGAGGSDASGGGWRRERGGSPDWGPEDGF